MEKISDDEFYDNIDVDSKSEKKTGKKKKATDVIQLCNDLETKMIESFKANRAEIRRIKREYQKKINKLDKHAASKKPVGINNVTQIPNVLADLIDVKRGTKMARTELGKHIYEVFKERDLLYEDDKRVMRVDNELAKIFETTTAVNQSTDPKAPIDIGFNFYNMQSYIKRCFENSKDIVKSTKKK